MSILCSDNRDIYHDLNDVLCFFCFEVLTLWGDTRTPIIHWAGATGDIYLHPDCVLQLAIRMFRDVHEVQIKKTNR